MDIRGKLEQLEGRLQVLIEGSAARLFPDHNLENLLANRLVDALLAGTKQNSEGKLIAPNQFTIVVNPTQAARYRQQEDFFDGLSQSLQDAGDEAQIYFLNPPSLQIEEDSDIPLNQIRVHAQISTDNLTRTTDILVDIDQDTGNLPANAFLIINGTQIMPLAKSVINIGRRPDNHLSIDDPRVSRVHAQLRAIKGHFILFDLGSRGGTFVNSKRIHQSALYPGDVITLAGFPMVYGQDTDGIGETQRYTPGQEL